MASPNLLCGPLLRYTWTDRESFTWHGSALIVTKGESAPSLHLSSPDAPPIQGVSLLTENGHSFWRFSMEVQMEDKELEAKYWIRGGDLQSELHGGFWVPAKMQTMRVLFHSCNGFEVSVKPGTYTGPALWNDVMRIHGEDKLPFHVMVGGGDQVYSDAVRTTGPLKAWAKVNDPKKRARLQLTDELDNDMDEWYFNNYNEWYSTEPFCRAAAAIPSCNIYDDHDIIDGFGSYPHKYQKAPIFMAIGRIAYKYYALFQLQMPVTGEDDPSWVLGPTKGPYIEEPTRSICNSFGPRTIFYGLDCRTERSLDTICTEGTYNAMFERLNKEVVKGKTEHLLLLLGVPIFYPRLVFAERLMTSSVMVGPLKKLNRVFGVLGGLFNQADGAIELLDDLNDHWCAKPHKEERNALVKRLQDFALEKEVRVTILSGDVHLAAIGRTFSKEHMKVPQNKDHRYIVNVISSAITNAPPPVAVANMLDRRNKMHHLDENTDEDLMAIFHENADGDNNIVNTTTMPARNYCIIVENAGLEEGDNPVREPESQLSPNAEQLQAEGQEEVKKAPGNHVEEDGRQKAGLPDDLPEDSHQNAVHHVHPHKDAGADDEGKQNVIDVTQTREYHAAHDKGGDDDADGPADETQAEKEQRKEAKRAEKVASTAEKLQAKDVEMQAKAQDAEKPEEDMAPARQQEGGFHHASAAAPASGTRRRYALDVSIRVEIDPKDSSGRTRPYGFLIPALEL